MKTIHLFDKIKELKPSNKYAIDTLYFFSKRGVFVILLLSTIIAIALYPQLNAKVFVWYLPLVAVLGYRQYNVYVFEDRPETYTKLQWYKQFTILLYTTGILYSSLGFIYIHFVDVYYQFFILFVIIGLSSGTTFALSFDVRFSAGYMSILILPLIVTLLLLPNMPLNYILSGILSLYYLAQINIIYNLHIRHEESKNLESSKMLLHNFFTNAPLGILMYDEDLIITDKNKELISIFNHGKDNVIGVSLHTLPDPAPIATFKDALEKGVAFYSGSYRSIYGEVFSLEIKAFSYVDKPTNKIVGIAIIENKTKEYEALKKLEYMADHDILTGLLNRRGFKNYMDYVILDPKHEAYYSILFYLDLNQFKGINDSLGHAVGDKVLINISQRLLQELGNTCKISRLGGDEFNIMIPHVAIDENLAYEKSEEYANTIKSIFSEPCIVDDTSLHVKTSIGIVILEPGYTDTEEIIRHADLTMYQAKHAVNHTSYYDPSLDEKQKELFILQQNLVYAATHEELKLFFQPVVQMKDEKLLSAEVLLRWQHPQKGLLGPEVFIPLAIKAGLLSKITWWLVESVCQQIAQWKKEGIWKLNYISININSAQLIENHFAQEFFEKLKQYNISTEEIMIEITERSLIDSFANTQGVINDLRSHGVKCAIDDFGTGYSSLSYLKKLSMHTLKIDREFIKDIGKSPKELVLVSTILDIGRQFNYNIIIEGIESEQQKTLLLELDEGLSYQGYFFSKPIHADEFTRKFMLK